MAVIVALCLLHFLVATAQECEKSFTGPLQFERVFVAKHSGGRAPTADSTMIANGLGGCRNLDEHSDKMIEHFKSWGVDLSSRREYVYGVIDDVEMNVRPKIQNPDAIFLVTTGSTFDFAETLNAAIDMVWWSLAAKVNLTGEIGTLPQGHLTQYGIFRIKEETKETCIEFYARNSFAASGYEIPIDFELRNEEMGKGEARGIGRLSRPDRDILDLDFVMTFYNKDSTS